jgi:hypothetical protein
MNVMEFVRRLGSLAALAVLAAGPASAATPTAAQIAERNVAARGGLAAWRAVDTLTLSGQLDAGGKSDAKLPFVLSMKRPLKSRLEIRFQDQTAVQVWDGVRGWKVRPFLGRNEVEAFTAVEAKAAAALTELDGPLIDHVKKGIRIELAGTEKVEGRRTYKLELTTKDGEVRHLWIDAKTFLETKLEGEPRKLDGRPHGVAVFYRDYRKVNGLTVPFVFETVVQGVKQTRKIAVQTVKVNPQLADALFAKPQLAQATRGQADQRR